MKEADSLSKDEMKRIIPLNLGGIHPLYSNHDSKQLYLVELVLDLS